MNLTVLRDGSERIGYDNPALPIYVRRGDLKSLSNMSALCHWHEDVEFLMPLKGYLSYNVNGTRVTVQEGNAVFVNARQMHYGFSGDGSDCIYVCITFRPQLLCASEEIRNRYVLPVVTGTSLTHLVLRKSIPEHRMLLSILGRLDNLYQSEESGMELQAMGLLHMLWRELYTVAKDRISDAVSTDVNAMIQKKMLEFIRAHYQERISVDAIAAAGGVCRTKCCQIFREYLGQSPNDYLNSFRLETGMQLLKSTDMTVTEIADACGFSSASYFTEMFSRKKGCTPRQYRREK